MAPSAEPHQNPPDSVDSDAAIIAAVLAGNTNAFSALVRRYESTVARTINGMLGPGDRAEEAGQVTMIKVFQGLASFRSDSSFKTYVTRIAMNTALDELRRQKRWFSRFWTPSQEGAVEPADSMPDPRDLAADCERQQRVRVALAQLKPEYRAVVVLRLVHGYSPAEVATILEISEGTVFSRLSRARAQLRELLSQETGNG